jgi:hypothetical protein
LNYLEDDYQIENPKDASWLGGLIDTSKNYHSQLRMAFMRNSRDIRDFIANDYYLAGENLYIVSDNLNLNKVNNDSIKESLKKDLNNFKTINLFTIEAVAPQTQYHQKTLLSEDLDFDIEVPEYYSDDTSHIISKSGDVALLMKTDQTYGTICKSIEIGKGVSRINIYINFNLFINKYGSKPPVIVIDLQNDDEHIEWFGIEFMSTLNPEKIWNNINITKTLFIDSKNSNGSILKIYIWNKHGSEIFYDDLGVEVKVKQL